MELTGVGTLAGILIIFVLIVFVAALAMIILEIIGKWKVFKKAGKNGWEAIIPYYNTWVLVSISGCKWWFFLIIIFSSLISFNLSYDINEVSNISINTFDFLGSIVNLLALYCVNYNVCKKFNKDYMYAIGLTLLPFIFYPMLGFDKTEFNNSVKVSPYGVIKEGEK